MIQLPSRAGGVQVLGWTGRHPARFLHIERLLPRELDRADRRRHQPHGDARHPQGDRPRRGPQSAILALGYAGWAPGQLENEIQHNGWLHCASRCRANLRPGHRRQIRAGAEEDRHRSRHALERSRARVAIRSTKVLHHALARGRLALLDRLSACSSALASSAPIGSPK